MGLSVHDSLLDVVWLCVCTLGGSLAGEVHVSFVVVVGASVSALGDRMVLFVCECNRHSFLATVFESASVFYGDLSHEGLSLWDVAKVTTMLNRKSIRILENDVT
jgi:hypothetical protein